MQINIAFASIFQLNDVLGGSPLDNDPFSGAAYRGTMVIPFFANRTSYSDLYSGLEYRLNKYSQVHTRGSQGVQLHNAESTASPLDPLFMCHCPHCSRRHSTAASGTTHEGQAATIRARSADRCDTIHESDVNLGAEEYAAISKIIADVTLYPLISVVSIQRRMVLSTDVPDELHLKALWQGALQRGDKDLWLSPYHIDDVVLMPRDATSVLSDEVVHFNVFFQSRIVLGSATNGVRHVSTKHAADERCHVDAATQQPLGCLFDENSCDGPVITANGMTHRSSSHHLGVDHCPLFISEPKPVEVAIFVAASKPRLRFRFPQFHTVRDLMIRLEQTCGGRVSRVVDTETGAAILPCEVLGHVVWKLRSRMAVEWFPFPELLPPSLQADGGATQDKNDHGLQSTQLLTINVINDGDDGDDDMLQLSDGEGNFVGLHEYGLGSLHRKRQRQDSSSSISFDEGMNFIDSEDSSIGMSVDDDVIFMDDDDDNISIGEDTVTIGRHQRAEQQYIHEGEASEQDDSSASTFQLARRADVATPPQAHDDTTRKSSKRKQRRVERRRPADDNASIRISELDSRDDGEPHWIRGGFLDAEAESDGKRSGKHHDELGWMSSSAPMHRRPYQHEDASYCNSDDGDIRFEVGDEVDVDDQQQFLSPPVFTTQPIEYAKVHMMHMAHGEYSDDEDEVDFSDIER